MFVTLFRYRKIISKVPISARYFIRTQAQRMKNELSLFVTPTCLNELSME